MEARSLRRMNLRGGLLGFIIDVGGFTSTYSPRFDVVETERGYTIVHRQWLSVLDLNGNVEIATRRGTFKIIGQEIWLDGRSIGRICAFGWRCFNADELRLMAFMYAVAWYWHYREQSLERLACMLQFGDNVQPPAYSDESYIYAHVYEGLDKFLNELARMVGTSKLYYKVRNVGDGHYVVADTLEEWVAKFDLNGNVEVITRDGYTLRTTNREIQINGETYDKICVTEKVCLGADALRLEMFMYITLWYWNVESSAIWRFAKAIRPCDKRVA